MGDAALATLAAMLSAGLGFRAGKRSGGPKPTGPVVQNADIIAEAKKSCATCKGKGYVVKFDKRGRSHDGPPRMCTCAIVAFRRRHGHETTAWRGEVHWKGPRAT